MTTPRITFTDRELDLIASALVKCDVMSDLGELPQPWAFDHDDDETLWLLTKICKMGE
jgi:hypothetical protein